MNLEALPEGIRRRIQVTEGHWLWDGHVNEAGYGDLHYNLDGKTMWRAHRLVYRLLIGPPPEHLHHRCEIKLCVRPNCLQEMTVSQHMTHHHGGREACFNGHPFTPENTYVRRDGGGRQCRRCKARRQRQRYADLPPAEAVRLNARYTARRRAGLVKKGTRPRYEEASA
jgi:hypothetical protein